jgi:DNA-damage-inducible protein J
MDTDKTNVKMRLPVDLDAKLMDDGNKVIQQMRLSPTAVVSALYKRIIAEQEIPFKLELSARETAVKQLAEEMVDLLKRKIHNAQELADWLNDDNIWN